MSGGDVGRPADTRNPEKATGLNMPRISKTLSAHSRPGLNDLVETPDAEHPDGTSAADAHEPPLVEDLDADDDAEPADGQQPEEAESEPQDSGGADDALGLYLRQMGAI